jgi:hypothetical protein
MTRKYWRDIKKNERCDVGLGTPIWGYKKDRDTHFSDDGFYTDMWQLEIVTSEDDPEYEKKVFDDCYKHTETYNVNPGVSHKNIDPALRREIELYWFLNNEKSKTVVKDMSKKFGVKRTTISGIINKYKRREGIL